ncbi:hypothetical protein K438DRAFT_1835222 [Mycena galopus ATCC 62051]|nr:hypothetical protein K438DRAFT_1835222 [Mycena galopus ATCC 62051]
MNAPKIQDDEASIFKRATLILNEFPMDTLIHIQSFMFPLDIIALRQCSKLMASATSHRTVWLDALRRICATHEVSVLTYPMENMTLRELEHAATSPARFIAQISKDMNGELIPAFSTRLFQPRLPRSTTGNVGETLMLRLIPGGRYLVMAGELARISVWDLGYGPAAVINPYPLASTILPFATHRLLIQPTKNKQGFRILTISNQAINNVVDVTVYEIYPAAANPTLQQFAHRRVFNTPDIEAFAFTPDRFTYYCNFLLTMWDFVQDTSATVHVYQPLMSVCLCCCHRPARKWNRRSRDPPASSKRHPGRGSRRGAYHSPSNVQPHTRRLLGIHRAAHDPGRLAHLPGCSCHP